MPKLDDLGLNIEMNITPQRASFDMTIGRLDRALSEVLALVNDPLDPVDWQTLKHHADDLIGVGNKLLDLFYGSVHRKPQ